MLVVNFDFRRTYFSLLAFSILAVSASAVSKDISRGNNHDESADNISASVFAELKESALRTRYLQTNATDGLGTNIQQPRIVGGRPSSPGDYPSFGRSAGLSLCGGTLIHPDIFLSAAHCKGAFRRGIYLGGVKADASDSEYFGVDSEYPHPNYNSFTTENDIMLVKLSTPSTAPIQTLNFDDSIPMEGDPAIVIGFGLTEQFGDISNELLQVEVETLNYDECNNYWDGEIIDETMICAGVSEGGKDTCQGDSGGPIFAADGSQIGITSFGDGCALPDTYPVYTRISGFENFINDGICDYSDERPSICPADNPNDREKCPCGRLQLLCRLLNYCLFMY